jgi:hypothetical protein
MAPCDRINVKNYIIHQKQSTESKKEEKQRIKAGNPKAFIQKKRDRIKETKEAVLVQ